MRYLSHVDEYLTLKYKYKYKYQVLHLCHEVTTRAPYTRFTR